MEMCEIQNQSLHDKSFNDYGIETPSNSEEDEECFADFQSAFLRFHSLEDRQNPAISSVLEQAIDSQSYSQLDAENRVKTYAINNPNQTDDANKQVSIRLLPFIHSRKELMFIRFSV